MAASSVLSRLNGPKPFIKTARRHAGPFRSFSDGIAPLSYLADSFFLKFRGKCGVPIDYFCAQTIGQICLKARGTLHFIPEWWKAKSRHTGEKKQKIDAGLTPRGWQCAVVSASRMYTFN
ncbi:hypothetical protein SEENP069_19728 [Salmonella enterica subsp. enterica serovar Newport str. RI_10P069]|nr:hypothetical protein SEENP069_19728 [Salmonella enterica subsp. enterica serovar Newport str. RI_10P069]